MNNSDAFNEITNTYDHEQMQEIVNHGCISGVCSQHIYYGDTISFFDKYEGEILDLIHIRYGVDTLVEMFKEHDACYDAYRNDCCWLFIENVATDYVIEMEDMEEKENMIIEDYMKESISNNGYTLTELNESAEDLKNLTVIDGYNPPRSMTPNRYLHH